MGSKSLKHYFIGFLNDNFPEVVLKVRAIPLKLFKFILIQLIKKLNNLINNGIHDMYHFLYTFRSVIDIIR